MAYLDEMALEREKSKQAMIAGKQPLLGDNTTAALHELGVSLGLVPKGAPVSETAKLAASLIGPPKSVKVDEAKPLQVQPLVGRTTASLQQPLQSDDSVGNAITGGLGDATNKALQRILQQERNKARPQTQQATAQPAQPNANIRAMSTRGRTLTQPQEANPSGAKVSASANLEGVDPKAAQAAKEWSQVYHDQGGQYSVVFTSGKRAGDPREHGRGNAFDMQLVDKKTGKPLENYRTNDPATFKAYQDYANGFHQYLEANYPDLAARHRWGGYFSGDRSKYGSLDQMHHDFAGDRIGMAGGSWKDGLSPQQAKLFPGLVPGGGLAGKPPMAAGKPAARPLEVSKPAPAAPAGAPQAGGVPPELSDWVAKKENFTANAFGDYGTTNIGYGTSAKGRTSIDEPTARAEMNAELGKHLATIDALNPNTPPAIRNSLASLAYNTGGAALNGTGLAAAVKAGDWKQAKEIFVQYDKVTDKAGNKTPLHGLTIRRGQEAQAFDNPNFYKNPNAGTTAAQDWGGQQHPAASTPAPQAPPQPAPQASPQPAGPPEAPALVAPQVTPQGEATPKPITPAPAATTPAPAAAAPAPAAPQVSSSPPPAKPAPQVNPAHAFLDTKIIDLVNKGDPSKAGQIPGFIANKTLREAINTPMIGGQVLEGVKPYLDKAGVTPQQFNQALKEGQPKPGKRSDVPVDPSQQKVRYAQADTGTMSDASPELPADASSTAAAAGPVGAGQEGVAPAAKEPSAPAAVETVPLPPERPNVQGVLDQARREYPILKNQDYGYVENPQPGQGYLEHWPAGEEGAPGSPRPAGLPMDKPGLEIRDPSTRPIDVAGDITSHQLIHTDPTVKATYERFQKSLTPEQNTRLEEQYANAQANEGETRPYAEWREASGEPAYFRGYPFQQWPAEEHEKMYTPEQRADLDKMMGYLKGQPQAPQAPQPSTPQQTPISPGIAKALEDAVKPADAGPGAPPPPAEALPVLPAQPAAPMPPSTGGGLSLAPAGLSSIPTGALGGGAPGSQGGSIAMAGMLPPIENSTFSTPLLDSTAASAPGGGMGLSPIPFQTLGSWGWGGGGNIGAGFDWGGGGGGVSMPMLGGYE